MTLHPNITIPELDAYCQLSHEHKIKTVKVDPHTYQRIKYLKYTPTHQGIRFIQQQPIPNPEPSPLEGGKGGEKDNTL